MPIVVPARASTRLRQGDIVKACTLTVTDHVGGQPSIVSEQFRYLLVLSRDCRAIRDELISVAPLKSFPLPDEGATFEKVHTVLTVSRDGGRNPDLFYIGPVVPDGPRFAADLRTPFVIKIPPEGSQRDAWIFSNRLARIDDDFIDHLHSRIFSSFARKGFDDHEWLPDADLRLLLAHAASEEATLDAEEKDARAEAERADAAGGNDHRARGLFQKADKKAKELADLRKKTAPFHAEQARRASAAHEPTAVEDAGRNGDEE